LDEIHYDISWFSLRNMAVCAILSAFLEGTLFMVGAGVGVLFKALRY
jgi:hypothetical protein